MASFAKVEDAPHHLIRLDEYGKTSVTIAVAFLGLSAAFVDKLLKPPFDWPPIILLSLLWLSLLAVLVLGLLINASLVSISTNYARAKGIAYPDALMPLSDGQEVEISDEKQKLKVDDRIKQQQIKDALKLSSDHQAKATKYANASFVMIFIAGVLTVATGLYQSVQLSRSVEAGDAVEKSIDFVEKRFSLKHNEAKFHTLTFDEKSKAFSIELLGNPISATQVPNASAVATKYEVTIDGESGKIKKAHSIP